MKRNLLIATACFFLCAVAIVFFASSNFHAKASVPASAPRAIERNADMPSIKNLLPKFKHKARPYAP